MGSLARGQCHQSGAWHAAFLKVQRERGTELIKSDYFTRQLLSERAPESLDALLTPSRHQGPFRLLTRSFKSITKLIKFHKIEFELNTVSLLLLPIYIKSFLQGHPGDSDTPN